MGFKFRKSVKIAPGVRMNLGTKGASVSFGGKGFRKTYSTSGRKTTTVGIPGTGLSYSKSTSTKKSSSTRSKKATSTSTKKQPYTANASAVQNHACEPAIPQYKEDIYNSRSIGFFVISVPSLLVSLCLALAKPVGLLFVAISLFLLWMGFVNKKLAHKAKIEEEPIRLARNAELLEWQNAICEDKSEQLIMSVKQLEVATEQAVSNDIRIFDDCSNILNKTTNPSVFFSRLSLTEEKLLHLCSLEKYLEKMSSIAMDQKPSELYNQFLAKKERCVCDFIYRYYWTVKDKAETLKTEKGKQNQYKKFYDSLQPYSDQISEKNKGYIEAMYQQKI